MYVLSELRNEEQMAVLLQELYHLMLSKDIAVHQYTIRLEEPMRENNKPGSGNNLYLVNFPTNNISVDQEILVTAIRKHRLDWEKNNNKH
ncbi:MAG: hypothetical protein AB2421_05120 [Thermotaleaceae bacterium]